MIYRVIFSLLIAKAAGFASHPDHHHDDGHMMDDHHDDDHPGHTHDELHTHVELHDCSTAEAFTNVYGCLMQQQMAGCWECPHRVPSGPVRWRSHPRPHFGHTVQIGFQVSVAKAPSDPARVLAPLLSTGWRGAVVISFLTDPHGTVVSALTIAVVIPSVNTGRSQR